MQETENRKHHNTDVDWVERVFNEYHHLARKNNTEIIYHRVKQLNQFFFNQGSMEPKGLSSGI